MGEIVALKRWLRRCGDMLRPKRIFERASCKTLGSHVTIIENKSHSYLGFIELLLYLLLLTRISLNFQFFQYL
ncbi:MAG: hypothetical protein ABFS02_13830, partial [Pseudomonadota bacterium]